jgi:hypothetical protein
MKKIILFALGISVALLSCEQDDPNIGQTATKDLAGEWYVTYTVDGTDLIGHAPIITSNTAANLPTEILITDYVEPNATAGNFWSYKVKAQVDPAAKEFTATEVVSSALYDGDPYNIKVNVLNGKVIKNGGHSRTGVVVDSIYFELQFEDDSPAFGTTYVVSGHKRTGFTADDY